MIWLLLLLTPLPPEVPPMPVVLEGRLFVCKHDALFRIENGHNKACFKLMVPDNIANRSDLGPDSSEAAYHPNDLRKIRIKGIIGRKLTEICWELTVIEFEWIDERKAKGE